MRRLVPPLLLLPALALAADPATLPITTSSPEARALYLEGRDLVERLKATEGHFKTDQAVRKDPQFALGWLQWAQTSGTAKEFFAGMDKALATSSHASEAEQKFIRAADAGAKSRPAEQERLLAELVKQFPADPRIQFSPTTSSGTRTGPRARTPRRRRPSRSTRSSFPTIPTRTTRTPSC